MIPPDVTPVANHLWQSTLFVIAVSLLTLAFRRNRAAVRYGLWMAASLKFLIPFSLLVSLGAQLGWRITPPIAQNDIVSMMTTLALPFDSAASSAVANVTASPGRRIVLPLLIVFWVVGFAIVLLAWHRGSRRIRRVLSSASPVDMNLRIPVVSSTTISEPGIVGVFHPVLLLPEGIRDRLSADQLQAIVAHELCHAERRDNLTATIHMFVESLFWFHPLVWWIERQLLAERESACDEEVLRLIGRPEAYAEGILNVCKFYKESPAFSMPGVTGSSLKKRIEAIMVPRSARKLSTGQRALLVAAAITAIAIPVGFGLVSVPGIHAQSGGTGLPIALGYLRQMETEPNNQELARQAILALEGVLKSDPNNSAAVAGLANAYLRTYDLPKAREYFLKYAALNPLRAQGFYAVGAVDWMLAFNKRSPLPAHEKAAVLDEGIRNLEIALTINPEYADAMTYKNLLLREKATLEADPAEHQKLIDEADRLFDRSREILALPAKSWQSASNDADFLLAPPPPPPPPPPNRRP